MKTPTGNYFTRYWATAALATSMATTGIAFAASPSPTASPAAAGMTPAAQTSPAAATTGKESRPLSGKLMRGSEIVGANIFNQQGEDLGEINDVLFDENTGGMTHAVLAMGGFLGIGEKLTAVPWKHIRQSEKDTKGFVVEADKAKLKAAESFDMNAWPDLDDAWLQKNYTSYGLTGKAGKKLVRASKVEGAKLFNQQGEQIGTIREVLLHPNSGKVGFAILAVGEYVNQADKLTTVPWSLVRQSKQETPGYVLNVDKAKLQGATYFDANVYPNYSDPEWNTRIYSFYGTDPYWHYPVEY